MCYRALVLMAPAWGNRWALRAAGSDSLQEMGSGGRVSFEIRYFDTAG